MPATLKLVGQGLSKHQGMGSTRLPAALHIFVHIAKVWPKPFPGNPSNELDCLIKWRAMFLDVGLAVTLRDVGRVLTLKLWKIKIWRQLTSFFLNIFLFFISSKFYGS
jgi:hypothetical protein